MKHFCAAPISDQAILLAVFVAALTAAPALHAQEMDLFADDVQVRVVNIDTVVTDKKGAPVTGLSREDFELMVDGKPITISHFSEMGSRVVTRVTDASGGTGASVTGNPKGLAPEMALEPESIAPEPAPANQAPNQPDDQRLNLIVYLDRSYTGPGDLKDLGQALRRFLDQNLQRGDRVMLVSVDRRVEVLLNLTTLTSAIDPLIEQELSKQGRGLRILSEYRDILRNIGDTLETGTESQARHPEHHTQNLLARINGFSEEAYRDLELTGKQLQQVIASLAGIPGRKVVLYVGGRLPVSAGQTLLSAWQSAFGRNSTRWQTRGEQGGGGGAAALGGGAGGVGGDAGEGSGSSASSDGVLFESMATPDSMLDATQLFVRAGQFAASFGVRFYSLDAGGQRSSTATTMSRGNQALATNSGGSQWEYGRTQRISSQNALGELAEITGGRSLGESRNFDGLLGTLREDLEVTYSLGFEAPDVGESSTHQIEVRLTREAKKKLRRPRIRHRQVVRNRSADQEAAETTLSALLFDSVHNPMGVEISITGDVEDSQLPILIKVPLTRLALLPETKVHTGKLTVFVTSGDLESGATPVRRAVVPVRIPNEDIMNVVGQHLEYSLMIDVNPDSRRLAVGVRDDLASLFSTVALAMGSR